MTQAVARGYATRVANMQRRRERILDDARALIAEQGFDGLNLRDLAERADATSASSFATGSVEAARAVFATARCSSVTAMRASD